MDEINRTVKIKKKRNSINLHTSHTVDYNIVAKIYERLFDSIATIFLYSYLFLPMKQNTSVQKTDNKTDFVRKYVPLIFSEHVHLVLSCVACG